MELKRIKTALVVLNAGIDLLEAWYKHPQISFRKIALREKQRRLSIMTTF